MKTDPDSVLGYDRSGRPILPTQPGRIYTQAFILCDACGRAIRTQGGPNLGSTCHECHQTLGLKTRDQIIQDMCLTMRHDYGLDRDPDNVLSSGMTDQERQTLWASMAQIFDNCIAPYMILRK